MQREDGLQRTAQQLANDSWSFVTETDLILCQLICTPEITRNDSLRCAAARGISRRLRFAEERVYFVLIQNPYSSVPIVQTHPASQDTCN